MMATLSNLPFTPTFPFPLPPSSRPPRLTTAAAGPGAGRVQPHPGRRTGVRLRQPHGRQGAGGGWAGRHTGREGREVEREGRLGGKGGDGSLRRWLVKAGRETEVCIMQRCVKKQGCVCWHRGVYWRLPPSRFLPRSFPTSSRPR